MKRVIIISLLLIGSLNLLAQERLTLEEAINIALKNSLDIRIARNNLEASIIGNHISMAGGLPEISATASNTRSLTNLRQELSNGTVTKRSGAANNQIQSGLAASYVLFNGFRVYATKGRLAALENQSETLITVHIQNTIAGVMLKYYDIVRQHSYLRTIRESLAVTLQRKRLAEARQSVGLANNADTYQALLDSTAAVQELLSQELIINQSKADLMNLLTQRPDSSFEISDTIIIDSTVNMGAVMANLEQNAEVLSAEQQITINELIVREIGAQRYPSVAINGGYNFNRSQNAAGFTLLNQTRGPFVGLSLAVPIFNGGQFRRQQRVAEVDVNNARLTRQNLVNDLQSSAVKAYQAYQNNLARLASERENNRIAAALLSLVQQRIDLGVGTIVDVREAQRSFVEAGYRLVNLAYAAKVAEIELKRIATQLVP
ncbi:MAG: TolC family protein [Segetibacter sp.]|nr:TolC family protein [Segetibacter sp.]